MLAYLKLIFISFIQVNTPGSQVPQQESSSDEPVDNPTTSCPAPDETADEVVPAEEPGASEEEEDDAGEDQDIKVPPTKAAMQHPIYEFPTLKGPDRPTLCKKCRQYVPLWLKDTHECVLPHYLRVTFPLNPEVC